MVESRRSDSHDPQGFSRASADISTASSSLRLIRVESDYYGVCAPCRLLLLVLSRNFSRCQQFLDEIGASGCEAAGVARKWRWWKMTGRRPGWGSLWLVPSIDPVSSSMKLPGRLRREWLLARRCRRMGKRDRRLETASVYVQICVCMCVERWWVVEERERMGYTGREEETSDRTIVWTRET